MPELWRIEDDLPGEHSAREYLEAVGFPPDVVDEMEAQRLEYEAEFPPVEFSGIAPCDPWGLASEWAASGGDDDLDLFGKPSGKGGE